MKATAIFLAFLLLFTTAALAVPIPMFPGNMVPILVDIPFLEYIIYLEAFTNGLTYSFVSWVIFLLLARKLENSTSMKQKKRTNEKRGLSAY